MNNLILKQIEIGPMENFVYFIGDKNTKDVFVVDPAWDINFLMEQSRKDGLSVKGALITHGHFDHTNGVEELLKSVDIPIYINSHELDFFKFAWGENVKRTESGQKIKLGEIEIQFIHTPGHTPGSQCFLVSNNLVSGDTLFINGCGRCDLPGGDVQQMFDTIYNKLMKMNDDTIIYPGHNYADRVCDSIANQKITNPYMQHDNLMNFIGKRMPKLNS